MKTDRCPAFCADACTNGYCPAALYEEHPEIYERRIDCDECYHNTGDCNDCIFENSEICIKNEKPTS